jgi:GTPase SAR1 family protein
LSHSLGENRVLKSGVLCSEELWGKSKISTNQICLIPLKYKSIKTVCWDFAVIQTENSLSEMLGKNVSDFGFFHILEYLEIYNVILWGWNPSLNTEFIYVSYVLHTHSLKVILCNIFSNFIYEDCLCTLNLRQLEMSVCHHHFWLWIPMLQ